MFLIQLVTIFLLFFSSLAGAESWSPAAPTPVQVYREASDATETPTATPAPIPVTVPQETMSQVAPPAQDNVPSFISSDMRNNAQSILMLKQQVLQLNQNFLLSLQHQSTKIEDLEKQVAAAQAQMKQLGQVLMMLGKELGQLKESTGLSQQPRYDMMRYLLLAAGLVFLVLLFFVFRYLLCRKKPEQKSKAAVTETMTDQQEDTEDEYDYMGSSESIPAKLNLARAYIVMEDYGAAQNIIDEVQKIGSQAQQAEAASLQKDISDNKGSSGS